MTRLVEVRGLKKHFPLVRTTGLLGSTELVRAVDGVDLSVERGETVGLVGESGCGKSTLGRCVLRLIEPSSGSVCFEGSEILALSPARMRELRRRMQIVFQDPFSSLDPRWRVGDILSEALDVHASVPPSGRRAEVERLLTSVGLSPGIAGRFPHEFSGGQRQRIGIARALAVRPDFLVADEAVSALDVSVRAQILNLLAGIQQRTGIGMLFIGHDLAVVRQVSHRIAVMYLGKIVEEAAADSLFTHPSHPYTRALLESIPSVQNAGRRTPPRAGVKGDVPSPVDIPAGCRFRARCPFSQEICAEQEPPLMPLSTDATHRSACHFADKLPPFDCA